METKDIILIATNIIGWTLAVVFFVLKRKNEKKDKALEKRFDIYSSFLKKTDELNENLRTDPSAVYGISTEYLTEVLANSEDENKINEALAKFNSELLEFTKKATQPLQILNSELNNLTLVASDQLLTKINEYKTLASDYNNDYQKTLNKISPSDSNDMIQQLQTIGHDKRNNRIGQLYQEMVDLMRKEIDYYNK